MEACRDGDVGEGNVVGGSYSFSARFIVVVFTSDQTAHSQSGDDVFGVLCETVVGDHSETNEKSATLFCFQSQSTAYYVLVNGMWAFSCFFTNIELAAVVVVTNFIFGVFRVDYVLKRVFG